MVYRKLLLAAALRPLRLVWAPWSLQNPLVLTRGRADRLLGHIGLVVLRYRQAVVDDGCQTRHLVGRTENQLPHVLLPLNVRRHLGGKQVITGPY